MDEEKGFYDGLTDEEMLDGFGDEDEVSLKGEEVEEKPVEEEIKEEPEQADQPEEESEEVEEPEEEPAAEEKPADQLFSLNHLGEIKDYTREETITLAQKGLDYDRIRTERDNLKAEKAKLQEHEDFLNELAELAEMSVEDLMIETKAKVVQAEEKKKGYDITLEQAKYRVKSEVKARKKAEPKEEPKAEPEDPVKVKRDESFARFVDEYPNVNVKDIPQEVWKEFGDGSKKDLTAVYTKYLLKQAQAKNETLEQNEKNKKRSTGSRRSNGSPVVDHDFDGWGEY